MQQVIGHRGAAGYAPENTLAAFEKARAMGCNFIEFDVMLSADGEAFVFHDENIKRTTNGRGEFGLLTAAHLRTLDTGRWYAKKFQGEKILSLRDAIVWLNDSGLHANIEIKPYPKQTEKTTIAVLTHINQYWPQDKKLPLISSFDLDALSLSYSIAPDIPRGLLLDKWQDNWQLLAYDLQCVSVHLSRRATTKARVMAIKAEGYLVYVYTVNWKRTAKKMLAFGVDAVFSDYPDLLKD